MIIFQSKFIFSRWIVIFHFFICNVAAQTSRQEINEYFSYGNMFVLCVLQLERICSFANELVGTFLWFALFFFIYFQFFFSIESRRHAPYQLDLKCDYFLFLATVRITRLNTQKNTRENDVKNDVDINIKGRKHGYRLNFKQTISRFSAVDKWSRYLTVCISA